MQIVWERLWLQKHNDVVFNNYLNMDITQVGRLTDTDTDIAIFKKPKPTPTQYLQKQKNRLSRNKNRHRDIFRFFLLCIQPVFFHNLSDPFTSFLPEM